MSLSKQRRFDNVPVIGDAPHQPKKDFPPREFGAKKKTTSKFQKHWFTSHPWIHYDEARDSAFCHTWIRAYEKKCISNNNIEPKWISGNGYTN